MNSKLALKHRIITFVTTVMLSFALFSQVVYAETQTFEICLVELESTDDGIELTWNPIDGAEKYEIYRKTQNGNYNKIVITDLTSYVDEAVKDFVTYTYYVQPVNDTENWGYEEASIIYNSQIFIIIVLCIVAFALFTLFLSLKYEF